MTGKFMLNVGLITSSFQKLFSSSISVKVLVSWIGLVPNYLKIKKENNFY
jgi:hypothetical protein